MPDSFFYLKPRILRTIYVYNLGRESLKFSVFQALYRGKKLVRGMNAGLIAHSVIGPGAVIRL